MTVWWSIQHAKFHYNRDTQLRHSFKLQASTSKRSSTRTSRSRFGTSAVRTRSDRSGATTSRTRRWGLHTWRIISQVATYLYVPFYSVRVWFSWWIRTTGSELARRATSWCACWQRTSSGRPCSSYSPTNRSVWVTKSRLSYMRNIPNLLLYFIKSNCILSWCDAWCSIKVGDHLTRFNFFVEKRG